MGFLLCDRSLVAILERENAPGNLLMRVHSLSRVGVPDKILTLLNYILFGSSDSSSVVVIVLSRSTERVWHKVEITLSPVLRSR